MPYFQKKPSKYEILNNFSSSANHGGRHFYSTFLQCKSMDWFLYDGGLRHEKVNSTFNHEDKISMLYSTVNRGVFRNLSDIYNRTF